MSLIPALLAIIAVGTAVFFLFQGLLGFTSRRRSNTEARLGAIAGAEGGVMISGGERRLLLRRVGGFDRRVSALPAAAMLKRDLRRAGLAWQTKDYLGVIAVSTVAFGGVGFLLVGSPPGAFVAALPGAAFPVLLVKRAGGRRAARMNTQVVDLIDVLASSLRSGFGFLQSIELAARQQDDPLGGELKQVLREVSLGMSTEDALDRLVVRSEDQDIEMVITAVQIQRRVGGNLAEVLDNISHMIRDRTRVRGEVKTLTAQARMSAWIVGLLPIALSLIITLIQPDYIGTLFTDAVGRLLVMIAIVLQITGFILVRRIAAIDY